MITPNISVIIPTYNRPHLVGRAVKSVLNQTYNNFELIIIDSSPDNKTERVIKKFDDPRVRYFHNAQKTILSAGKNQGIKSSHPDSNYIAFLDDDDEYLPQFLEKTVKLLQKNIDLAVATCYWELRAREGRMIREDKYSENFWEISVGSGSVINKKIFTEENIWYDADLPFMEDADFGLRLLGNHKLKSVPEVLRRYYIIPAAGDPTMSSNVSVDAVDLFYNKNEEVYKKINREALAYFYFTMGKMLIKAGAKKRGRRDLLKAFFINPHPIYFLHYILSLVDIVFPGIFSNPFLRRLKAKFIKGF